MARVGILIGFFWFSCLSLAGLSPVHRQPRGKLGEQQDAGGVVV